jgi:hypothetical protein
MRGSCIKCPDPPPPVRVAIGLVILAFNLLVTFGTPTLISTVMDIVGDLQMFRGIGMMAVVTNQEIQALYNQLALLTLDFSYERAQRMPRPLVVGFAFGLDFDFDESMSAALLVDSQGAMVSPPTLSL